MIGIQKLLGVLALASAIGCGDDGGTSIDPTDVKFGDTALVVVVNPVINDANDRTMPSPGPTRAGVRLTTDDGVTSTTNAAGIAVLAPLAAGQRTVTVSGSNAGGSFTVMMAQGELRELALSTQGESSQVMMQLDYKTDRVVELLPTMANAEVNAALAVSDSVIFVRGGVYVGDLDFSGSRVTLFGEGVLGGEVTLQGNVTVSGSNSRIRGARITGTLTIPASGVGVSFSQTDGAASATGSDMTFLANAMCGGGTITGSGSRVVGNAGVDPTTECP